MGSDFSRANLKNVVFKDSILTLSILGETKLSHVIFNHSILQSANYFGAKFNKIGFEKCDINNIDFSNTVLDGIDISTCTFERINVSAGNLRGFIVSPEQAVIFATLLGLKIKE
jgi:uncharacterized protein YjbI with pentapeptide repeats